jgi:hypothetical protein
MNAIADCRMGSEDVVSCAIGLYGTRGFFLLAPCTPACRIVLGRGPEDSADCGSTSLGMSHAPHAGAQLSAKLLGLPKPFTVFACVFSGWYAYNVCGEALFFVMKVQMRCLGSRVLYRPHAWIAG